MAVKKYWEEQRKRYGGDWWAYINLLSIPIGYGVSRKLYSRSTQRFLFTTFAAVSTFHITSVLFWDLEFWISIIVYNLGNGFLLDIVLFLGIFLGDLSSWILIYPLNLHI